MARTPEGWKLVRKPSGVYHVRFTHERHRYDVSTREREIGPAKKAAAQIYSDIISGRLRRATSGALVKASTELAVLCNQWLEDIASELAEDSERVYATYIRHWCEHMPTIGAVTTDRIGDCQRGLLKRMTKGSMEKVMTAFRRFLRWAEEKKVIRSVPEFPKVGRKVLGTPAAGVRHAPTSVLTTEEVESILAWSKRDPFLVACWETGLRPQSTLMRLKREDLTPFGLVIRPECDKNGWGRTIPLTEAAREALAAGLPFGRQSRRNLFKRAAMKALGRRDVTVYDLKHARATALVESGAPLTGISFLLGVSVETLVARYVHPSRRAGEEALRCQIGARSKKMTKSPRQERVSVGSGPIADQERGGKHAVPVTGGAPNSATDTREVVQLHQNTYRDPSLPAAVRIALFRRAG